MSQADRFVLKVFYGFLACAALLMLGTLFAGCEGNKQSTAYVRNQTVTGVLTKLEPAGDSEYFLFHLKGGRLIYAKLTVGKSLRIGGWYDLYINDVGVITKINLLSDETQQPEDDGLIPLAEDPTPQPKEQPMSRLVSVIKEEQAKLKAEKQAELDKTQAVRGELNRRIDEAYKQLQDECKPLDEFGLRVTYPTGSREIRISSNKNYGLATLTVLRKPTIIPDEDEPPVYLATDGVQLAMTVNVRSGKPHIVGCPYVGRESIAAFVTSLGKELAKLIP